jgi:hypothetical protein
VNLRGYVATVTRNACDEYLRHRYPLRRSLKDKIRRHLLSNSEFALWEDTEHNWRACLSAWQDSNGALKDEPGELQHRLKTEWQTVDVQRLELHDLLTTIFRVARTPVEMDHLTELIASFWGRGESDELDLEIAESHLDACQTCLSEVQRYAERRDPVQGSPGIYGWQPWRIAAVMACGVVLIVLAVWFFRSRPAPQQE